MTTAFNSFNMKNSINQFKIAFLRELRTILFYACLILFYEFSTLQSARIVFGKYMSSETYRIKPFVILSS